MKKLILLFLCLGIFLINFTSAALNITILPPLTTPTLTLTRVPSGGTFSAGNYTFGIYADASGDGNYTRVGFPVQGYPQAAGRISNYTYANITLQAGDGLMINWSGLDPATAAIFVYKKTNTFRDYNGADGGSTYERGINATKYPTGVTITTDDFAVRGGGLYTYEAEKFYFGMRPDKGMGQIRVNSTVNFYSSDIMDAIRSSSMVEGEDYIEMGNTGVITVYSLDLTTSNRTINFGINNSLLYFAGGIDARQGARISNGGIQGSTILSTKPGGYAHSLDFGNSSLINVAIVPLQMHYTKGGVLYGESLGTAYLFSGTLGKSFINSSFLVSSYGGFDEEQFDSLVVSGTIQMSDASAMPTRQRTVGSSIQTYSNAARKNVTEQEFLLSGTAYQIFQTCNGNYSNYFLDSTFYLTSTGLFTKYPIVYIFNYAINYGTNTLYFGNRFNLNVTDGIATLPNANVLLYNKNNVLVFNTTTANNGSIPTQEVYYYSVTNIPVTPSGNANTTNSIINYSNPYTLIISKSGYSPYNVTFNLTDSLDWTIALDEEEESEGDTVIIYEPSNIYVTPEELKEPQEYAYLDYEISRETDTRKGVYLSPYIIKSHEN